MAYRMNEYIGKYSERLVAGLKEDLGPVIDYHLADETCEDIVLNDDGSVWVKCLGSDWQRVGSMAYHEAMGVISAVARLQNRIVDYDNPKIETVLPMNGARFEAAVDPMVANPIFSIRCRPRRIYTLEHYERVGMLESCHRAVVEQAIYDRKTILVSGGPGSGKTTFLNACLAVLATIPGNMRLGIIEDAPELQYDGPHRVCLLSTPTCDMLACLHTALRLRCDRLVVGEVRDHAALTMLKAFNTGHPGGLSTIHANDPKRALLRLASLVQEAVPTYDSRELIDATIDLVVHIDGPTRDHPRRVRTVADMGILRA